MSVLSKRIVEQFECNYELNKLYKDTFDELYNRKMSNLKKGIVSHSEYFGSKTINEQIQNEIIHELTSLDDTEIKKSFKLYEEYNLKNPTTLLPFTVNMMVSYFKLKPNTNDIVTLKEEVKSTLKSLRFTMNESVNLTNQNKRNMFYMYVAPLILESHSEEISMKEIGVLPLVEVVLREDFNIFIKEYNNDTIEMLESKIDKATRYIISESTPVESDLEMLIGKVFNAVNYTFIKMKGSLAELIKTLGNKKLNHMDIIRVAIQNAKDNNYKTYDLLVRVKTRNLTDINWEDIIRKHNNNYFDVLGYIMSEIIYYMEKYTKGVQLTNLLLQSMEISKSFIQIIGEAHQVETEETTESRFLVWKSKIDDLLKTQIFKNDYVPIYLDYVNKIIESKPYLDVISQSTGGKLSVKKLENYIFKLKKYLKPLLTLYRNTYLSDKNKSIRAELIYSKNAISGDIIRAIDPSIKPIDERIVKQTHQDIENLIKSVMKNDEYLKLLQDMKQESDSVEIDLDDVIMTDDATKVSKLPMNDKTVPGIKPAPQLQ